METKSSDQARVQYQFLSLSTLDTLASKELAVYKLLYGHISNTEPTANLIKGRSPS